MWKKFFNDIFNKGNFKDYFKRNKVFLLFSLAIVILSLLSGFYNYGGYSDIANGIMIEVTGIASLNAPVSDNFMGLFTNNFCSDIYVIAFGMIFSIPSVLLTVLNGVLIGYVFATGSFWDVFVKVLPYGIFEVIALILSLTGAFLVTKMEIRFLSGIISRKSIGDVLSRLKVPFKDLVLTLVRVLFLVVVGAIIEAYLVL
ncbi:MAG: hypothetical protein BZ135_04770 [Methanosphaera sp. rholeuAM6]|nr:MAG: hypothetical protein BZ135_04770 [Methanosphaera sp. rholeuAM6]